MDDRSARQEAEYEFPYHHIAHFDSAGSAARARILPWAVEYLVYLRRLREMVEALGATSVLDVGCGDGRFLGMLPATIARRVGVDLSERAILFARAFHPELDFEARDAGDLAEAFDVVTSIETLEHVPDEFTGHFLRALAACTAPGGHAVICVPTTVVPLNPKHFRHYDEELLARQVDASGADLELVASERVCRNTRTLALYRRLTHNSVWFAEIWPLRRRIWQHAWNVARVADASNGKHLIATYRRTA